MDQRCTCGAHVEYTASTISEPLELGPCSEAARFGILENKGLPKRFKFIDCEHEHEH